jgi:hypothetical protein
VASLKVTNWLYQAQVVWPAAKYCHWRLRTTGRGARCFCNRLGKTNTLPASRATSHETTTQSTTPSGRAVWVEGLDRLDVDTVGSYYWGKTFQCLCVTALWRQKKKTNTNISLMEIGPWGYRLPKLCLTSTHLFPASISSRHIIVRTT